MELAKQKAHKKISLRRHYDCGIGRTVYVSIGHHQPGEGLNASKANGTSALSSQKCISH